ncbi:hypothetical protein D9M68_845760 [compost metagenome]
MTFSVMRQCTVAQRGPGNTSCGRMASVSGSARSTGGGRSIFRGANAASMAASRAGSPEDDTRRAWLMRPDSVTCSCRIAR